MKLSQVSEEVRRDFIKMHSNSRHKFNDELYYLIPEKFL